MILAGGVPGDKTVATNLRYQNSPQATKLEQLLILRVRPLLP
jgi:hypothetical protein